MAAGPITQSTCFANLKAEREKEHVLNEADSFQLQLLCFRTTMQPRQQEAMPGIQPDGPGDTSFNYAEVLADGVGPSTNIM